MQQRRFFILIISFIVGFLCLSLILQYFNIKKRYEMEFNGVVNKITEGRMALHFRLKNNPYDPVCFYAKDEYLIQIGDSISKKRNSDKVEVYTLKEGKITYSFNLSLEKNQFLYENFIEQSKKQ